MGALDKLRGIMQTRAGGSAIALPPPAPRPPALLPAPSPPAPARSPTAPKGFLFDVTGAPPRPIPRATWAAPAQEGNRPAALKRAVQMLFGDAPPSPRRAAAAGWTKTGGFGKMGARWEHASGWLLEHCGHPTANYPWALYSPAGDMVRTGAVFAEPPDPGVGRAWPNLAMPMAYVTRLVPAVTTAPAAPAVELPAAPAVEPPVALTPAGAPAARPAAPEGLLFDVAKEGVGRCRRCGMKFKAGRCWICDKGEIPRPGTERYHAWTRGLMRTVRARLEAVGLGALVPDTWSAILLEDVPMPAAAAPLITDILALPISSRRYRALEERALLQDSAYRALRADGVEGEEADRLADETADEIMVERDLTANEPSLVAPTTFPFVKTSETRKLGHKTIGGTVTTWRGMLLGQRVEFRVSVRTNMDPTASHFMTSSNARLRHAGIEQAVKSGFFLDVQILEPRDPSDELVDELARVIPLAPDDRTFLIRRRGEPLRRPDDMTWPRAAP